MNSYAFIFLIMLSNLFSAYDVGDMISLEHQEMEFKYCYPSDSANATFSFKKYPNTIFILDMSATW